MPKYQLVKILTNRRVFAQSDVWKYMQLRICGRCPVRVPLMFVRKTAARVPLKPQLTYIFGYRALFFPFQSFVLSIKNEELIKESFSIS
jgi:hypothetical protein